MSAAGGRFSFVLSDQNGFRVDSRRGIVTKDMVIGPDTTIALRFTAAEMESLASFARRRHLMTVPQPHPARGGFPSQDPAWMDTLGVVLDGRHGRWYWQAPRLGHGEGEWARLWSVVDSIRAVLESKPEWRRLPPIRGGYL